VPTAGSEDWHLKREMGTEQNGKGIGELALTFHKGRKSGKSSKKGGASMPISRSGGGDARRITPNTASTKEIGSSRKSDS